MGWMGSASTCLVRSSKVRWGHEYGRKIISWRSQWNNIAKIHPQEMKQRTARASQLNLVDPTVKSANGAYLTGSDCVDQCLDGMWSECDAKKRRGGRWHSSCHFSPLWQWPAVACSDQSKAREFSPPNSHDGLDMFKCLPISPFFIDCMSEIYMIDTEGWSLYLATKRSGMILARWCNIGKPPLFRHFLGARLPPCSL